MKPFREFCESEAPSSVDANVGKPIGGKAKKDTDWDARLDSLKKRRGTKTENELSPIEDIYKGLGDRLASIDKGARERREAGEQTPFQKLFQSASDELKDILNK